MNAQEKVSITSLDRSDYDGIIEANLHVLETSFVLLDQEKNKVLVMNGSVADKRFKSSKSGNVVPVQTVTRNGLKYRVYLVSPDLL